jgi:predicted DCC family thiol-disulfide oxidoreductase YuxK
MKQIPSTTVYYNSACPVCDAGIASQKEKMQGCNIEWVDVHNNPAAVLELGTDLESVRERLHVKDEAGHIAIGAPALAALWANTPGQRFWGRIAKWPVARDVLGLAYNAFARVLYRWNRWKKHW